MCAVCALFLHGLGRRRLIDEPGLKVYELWLSNQESLVAV